MTLELNKKMLEINQKHEAKIAMLEKKLAQVEFQHNDLKQTQVKKQLEKSVSFATINHMKRKSLPTIHESASPIKRSHTKMDMQSMTVSRNTAREYAQNVMLTSSPQKQRKTRTMRHMLKLQSYNPDKLKLQIE